MTRKHIIFTACFSLILLSLIFIASPAQAKDVSGKTYYTTANIWYEDPGKIYSTNYHKGTVLPAGTKVKIKNVSSKEIEFEDEGGLPLRIIYVSKHDSRGSDVWKYFDRYFSESDPKGKGTPYQKFSKDEKTGIDTGEISEGMSKEAVLMAYGYPPGHRTPSLESNSWIYWINRFVNKSVTFRDNKVVSFSR